MSWVELILNKKYEEIQAHLQANPSLCSDKIIAGGSLSLYNYAVIYKDEHLFRLFSKFNNNPQGLCPIAQGVYLGYGNMALLGLDLLEERDLFEIAWLTISSRLSSGIKLKIFKNLILKGLDVNSCNASGVSLLSHAIEGDQERIFNYLIRTGVDKKIGQGGVSAPMLFAMRSSNPYYFKKLLNKNFSLNTPEGSDFLEYFCDDVLKNRVISLDGFMHKVSLILESKKYQSVQERKMSILNKFYAIIRRGFSISQENLTLRLIDSLFRKGKFYDNYEVLVDQPNTSVSFHSVEHFPKLIMNPQRKKLEDILKISSKSILKKIVDSSIEDNPRHLEPPLIVNPSLVNIIYTIQSITGGIDPQLYSPLFELLNNNKTYFYVDEENFDVLKRIFSSYSPRRIVSLFSTVDNIYVGDFIDMVDMARKIINGGAVLLDNLPKKPKSLSEVHDQLSLVCRKMSQENFKLQQKSVEDLDGVVWGEYILKVPLDSHQLIEAGDILKICVGNGIYAKRAKGGEINLLLLYQAEKLVGCLEVKGGEFSQAVGSRNSPIKLPGDFASLRACLGESVEKRSFDGLG